MAHKALVNWTDYPPLVEAKSRLEGLQADGRLLAAQGIEAAAVLREAEHAVDELEAGLLAGTMSGDLGEAQAALEAARTAHEETVRAVEVNARAQELVQGVMAEQEIPAKLEARESIKGAVRKLLPKMLDAMKRVVELNTELAALQQGSMRSGLGMAKFYWTELLEPQASGVLGVSQTAYDRWRRQVEAYVNEG